MVVVASVAAVMSYAVVVTAVSAHATALAVAAGMLFAA